MVCYCFTNMTYGFLGDHVVPPNLIVSHHSTIEMPGVKIGIPIFLGLPLGIAHTVYIYIYILDDHLQFFHGLGILGTSQKKNVRRAWKIFQLDWPLVGSTPPLAKWDPLVELIPLQSMVDRDMVQLVHLSNQNCDNGYDQNWDDIRSDHRKKVNDAMMHHDATKVWHRLTKWWKPSGLWC